MRWDCKFRFKGRDFKGEVTKSNHHTVWVRVDWGCLYINDANPVHIKRHRFKHSVRGPWQ